MKMQLKVMVLSLLGAWASTGLAIQPNANPTLDARIATVAGDWRLQQMIDAYRADEDLRFDEHMEVARIASPSRQEYYRAIELYRRLRAAGFSEEEVVSSAVNNSGIIPGAAVQQVDGRKVYQTCAIIKGAWQGVLGESTGIYSRPKIVIEGHIDTVNPATIPGWTENMPTERPDPWYFEPVKLAPKSDPVAQTPDELAAIDLELHFDANGKIIHDDNYNLTARGQPYFIYVPGYSDAMGNAISVYWTAKMFKRFNIKPVHDIWFCLTAGEEGRGNLAGMKQLYGYNQDNAAANPGDNGRNRLNIVANYSIDGGGGVDYLGSYRYEINFKGTKKGDGALEAASRIADIADVYAPIDDGSIGDFPGTDKTTYTVGIAYQKDDGSTSFEIDMRSDSVEALNELKTRLYPKFGAGETVNGVQIQQLWFGDRPVHTHADYLSQTDPLLFVNWKIRCTANSTCDPNGDGPGDDGAQIPRGNVSVNDNIPAAMDIPTINVGLGTSGGGGGGHAFNERGSRAATVDGEVNNFTMVTKVLLTLAGLTDAGGSTVLVPPAYGDIGPRHTNQVWDTEDIWTKK